MKAILLASALLGISAGQALAADATATAPAAFVWTGGYIGLQAGHAWGKSNYDVDINDAYVPYDPEGWFGGVYAGYNHQFSNNIVLGIEGDANLGDVKAGRTLAFNPNPLPSEYGDSRIAWHGSVRGRLGYAVDRLMPYVTGGVAFAKYEHTINFNNSKFRDDYTGWTAGVGLEYAATDNIVARIEYRYADYGEKKYAAQGGLFPHTTNLETHDIRVGVAYKF
ncbi:outer membrane protein [Aminobacter sp. MET-1]|uniref:outer membrane protein n=1 Tax=Aminobacter sp. MET-1 TaxID=2951085 RepID=UPI00226A5562|nr:outer membrane protein [Aminobacter sp. MET-1]MCX8568453.1 porin family protein [Aminobacter sp. MET-1]